MLDGLLCVRNRAVLGNYGVVIAMAEHTDEDPQETSRLTGRYANYCKVGHNAFEFVLDFGQYYPDNGEPQFHTRIISNPVYTKALLQLLGESIAQYEQTFGAILTEEGLGPPVAQGQQ